MLKGVQRLKCFSREINAPLPISFVSVETLGNYETPCTWTNVGAKINARTVRCHRASFLPFRFSFLLIVFFSGAFVAHRNRRRRCRRTELMASRRPNLIHRRLLAVYTVDLPHDKVHRNFISTLTEEIQRILLQTKFFSKYCFYFCASVFFLCKLTMS